MTQTNYAKGGINVIPKNGIRGGEDGGDTA